MPPCAGSSTSGSATGDVTVGGQPAGDNRIEKILGGCALLENWTGAGGMSGKSLNFYDPLREHWHQTWVDDRGGSLGLDGKFADGRMVLTGSEEESGDGQDHDQPHHVDTAARRPGAPGVGNLDRRRPVAGPSRSTGSTRARSEVSARLIARPQAMQIQQ